MEISKYFGWHEMHEMLYIKMGKFFILKYWTLLTLDLTL